MAIVQTAELERFLQMAFDKGASDLLLIANEPPCFRVNGVIQREDTPPLSSSDIRKIAMAALGEDQIRQIGSDVGRLITSCSLPGVVDGRMCIARSRGDYSIVVRLLPTILPDAHNLGRDAAHGVAHKTRQRLKPQRGRLVPFHHQHRRRAVGHL